MYPHGGCTQIDLLEVATIGMRSAPGCLRARESTVDGVGAGETWLVEGATADPWGFDPAKFVLGIGAGQSLTLFARELADGEVIESSRAGTLTVRAPTEPFFVVDGVVTSLSGSIARVGDRALGISTRPGGAPYLTFDVDAGDFLAVALTSDGVLTVRRSAEGLIVEARAIMPDGVSSIASAQATVPDGGDPVAFVAGRSQLVTGAEVHRVSYVEGAPLEVAPAMTLPGPVTDISSGDFVTLLLAAGRVFALPPDARTLSGSSELVIDALSPTELIDGNAISDGSRFVRLGYATYGGGEEDAGPPTIEITVETVAHPWPSEIGRPLLVRTDGAIIGERGMAGAIDQDDGARFVSLPAELGASIVAAESHMWATSLPGGRTGFYATTITDCDP